jgi:DNA modification methylase
MARLKPRVNTHATVKPTELMRHLVRLVTPFGGTVLDPFAGSGSTLIAAEQEGFAWIGIEKEAEYVAIAEARLNGTQRGLGLDVPAPTEKRGKMPPHVGPGTTWWDSVKRYGDEPSGEDAA